MIGKKLKYLIKHAQRKQIDLANFLGISPSRLSNYLSDKREPDFEMLAQMAKYLGVDLNYFAEVDFSTPATYKAETPRAAMVYEPAAAYGSADAAQIVNVHLMSINGKKHGIKLTSVPISALFIRGVAVPEKNTLLFHANDSVPAAIASSNDYLLCARCEAVMLENGDKIFENGRNAKFYRYYDCGEFITLINEENSKEHINVESRKDLNNYFKILWVIKKPE